MKRSRRLKRERNGIGRLLAAYSRRALFAMPALIGCGRFGYEVQELAARAPANSAGASSAMPQGGTPSTRTALPLGGTLSAAGALSEGAVVTGGAATVGTWTTGGTNPSGGTPATGPSPDAGGTTVNGGAPASGGVSSIGSATAAGAGSSSTGGTAPSASTSSTGGTVTAGTSAVLAGGTASTTAGNTTAGNTTAGTVPAAGGPSNAAGASGCVSCTANTPPIASIQVSPGLGHFDGAIPTTFTASSTGTWDKEDPPTSLTYAWDWQNDGVIDATGPTATHNYGTSGTHSIVLSVTDRGGLVGTVSFDVIVLPQADTLTVTTALDEADRNATPVAPGGSGFSLREAVAYADTLVGKQGIFVPSGMRIALTNTIESVDTAGIDVVGDGASLDGIGLKGTKACLTISTDKNRYFGLELLNCPARTIVCTGAHNQVSRSYLHDNGAYVDWSGSYNTFGPHNEIARGDTYAISLWGPNQIVSFSRIHDFTEGGIVIWAVDNNLLLGNLIYNTGWGIQVTNGANDNSILNNTIFASSGNGVELFASSGQIVMNNIIANSGDWGIRGDEPWFANHDYNDFFANTSGDCSGCTTVGTNCRNDNPQFINVALGDYRLPQSSPLRDKGSDRGYDLNGVDFGNGLFYGTAPDMGAYECQ